MLVEDTAQTASLASSRDGSQAPSSVPPETHSAPKSLAQPNTAGGSTNVHNNNNNNNNSVHSNNGHSAKKVSPSSVTIVKPAIITRTPAAASAETYQMDQQAAYNQFAAAAAAAGHPYGSVPYAEHHQLPYYGYGYGQPQHHYAMTAYDYQAAAPVYMTAAAGVQDPRLAAAGGVSAYYTVPTTPMGPTAAASTETSPPPAQVVEAVAAAQATAAPEVMVDGTREATEERGADKREEEADEEDEEPVIEPLDDIEPEPVWRGSLIGIGAPCPVEAFYLAGTTAYPLELPDELPVTERTGLANVVRFMPAARTTFLLVRASPESPDSQAQYEVIYNYFLQRDRAGVVRRVAGLAPGYMVYIVPTGPNGDKLPHESLPAGFSDHLLLAVIAPKNAVPAPSSSSA